MKFYSTRDRERKQACTLREAAMMGLAPDGGLFVPERIPQADLAEAERRAAESYGSLASYLAGLFFGDDFDMQALRRELESLYDFPVPLRRVGRSRYTLELFHGPTCAFKDFGAGFMGRVVGLLGAAGERLVILRPRREIRAAPWRTGSTTCRASTSWCSTPRGRSAACRSAR